jgi:small subunit ribosomal protein S3
MGQKIHPNGFRVGITRPWISRWTVDKKTDMPGYILQDFTIRRFLDKHYDFAGIAEVEIERTNEQLTVLISTARPGLLIGRKGKKLDELKVDLAKLVNDDKVPVKIVINELGRPELDARIVGQSVAEQLSKRMPFRRVLKKTLASTMAAGAKGIKIRISGRLGGAEMGRTETQTDGSVPLTTLSADISYALCEANTTYGVIGVKVWIHREATKEASPQRGA